MIACVPFDNEPRVTAMSMKPNLSVYAARVVSQIYVPGKRLHCVPHPVVWSMRCRVSVIYKLLVTTGAAMRTFDSHEVGTISLRVSGD